MSELAKTINLPEELLINKIYLIRDKKVMLDRDLADLYGVETRVLKQAVRRNLDRFPIDFMFEMSAEEFQEWRSDYGNEKSDRKGLRYAPFCFTEQGVAMLSSVLKSEKAIQVNIQIIRAFIKMRELINSNREVIGRLDKIEQELIFHDDKIVYIFEYLKKLEESRKKLAEQQIRPRIGYKQSGKNP